MNDLLQLLITFVNPMVLIMALVFTMSLRARSGQKVVHNDVVLGTMFALALAYSMSDPIILTTGGIFDMRGLLIGTCVALFGPRVGLLPLAVGLFYRWTIGMPGLYAGITSMVIAFSAGLVWRVFVAPHVEKYWQQALSLGAMISLQNLAIFWADPSFWATLFVSLGSYTLACNLIGTFLIIFLVQKERSYLSEARGLEEAAKVDHLTGLLNRRSLEIGFNRISRCKRRSDGITTIYFDVDNFKSINDSYGHAAGDAVLRTVAARLSKTFRTEDIFSRLGGDEFVAIIPNLNETEAAIVAERCRVLIADEPIIYNNTPISATISVGATWTQHTYDFRGLLRDADEALYEAKDRGRNAVAFKSETTPQPQLPRQQIA